MKSTMPAALIHSFGGVESVAIEEIPIPLPLENEVQIAIKCAGVNPVDWKIAEGLLKSRMPHQFPITLGWDAAGEISQVGPQVTAFKVGDPVFAYCRKETIHDGTYASYICVNSSHAAHKPANLSYAQAASVPLSSLTAWQSIYDTAHLKPGETILVHAGAGGVGGFAIQFAKLMGAHVITTTSPAHTDYAYQLGADEVIDYTQYDFADAILKKYPEGVDVVFDTVGEETLKRSYQAVKEGGRLVTIAGVIDKTLADARHVQASFVFVHPDGQELSTIGSLYNSGKIQPHHIQEVPLSEVCSALRKSREGHTQGKIILQIA